jgi:hypothetical protein
MDEKKPARRPVFFKLESLVASSRSRSSSRRACVRSSARVRSSSRCRACVSSRSRSGVRCSSRCRCSVSSRCRCCSRIACRSGALIARLVACSQSQCSHQGSEEEGFLHDHVLLWIKVSNSANVTGNVYVPNTDLGRWHRYTRKCPTYLRLGPKLYALSYPESINLASGTNLALRHLLFSKKCL